MLGKTWIRDAALAVLNLVASDIHDIRTGEKIARGVLIPWRGRVLCIGLKGRALVPRFVPQERLTFWKQELGFTTHPDPDCDRERGGDPSGGEGAGESPGATRQD